MSVVEGMHPDVAGLGTLLGTWRGEGRGEYPTIEAFGYREEVTFAHTGKPFLVYGQRTWHLADGRPLHVETGYWRVPSPGRVELVLAHPTGVVEVEEGTLGEHDGERRVELAATTVATTASAKEVTRLERTFTVAGDVLRYEVRMAAVGLPLQHHLAAELHRVVG